MTRPPLARRLVVVLGVVACLVAGIATVEAAAAWTAQSAPLQVAPESVESLTSRLAAEEARSATLQAQLDAFRAHATDLGDALQTATDRIAADTATAQELRDRLDAAKTRLAALERVIAKAKAQTAARVTAAPARATTPAPAGEPEHEGPDDD